MNANGWISQPVTTTDVSTVLGLSTHSISKLIGAAKLGGEDVTLEDGSTFRTAFKLKENGYSTMDQGKLIPGARPYWNIWSNFGPGFLHAPLDAQTAVANMQCLLDNKIDGLTSLPGKGYCFRLGAFRGYNHNAVGPTINVVAKGVNIGMQQTAIEVDFHKGDYNWLIPLNELTYDNVGLWVHITNHRTGLLIANKGIDPSGLSVELEGRIRGTVIIDVPYSELNVDVSVGIANYVFHNDGPDKPVYWELSRALMFDELIGVTHISNSVRSYATFEWRDSPYIRDASIITAKKVDSTGANVGTRIYGKYIWPTKTANGQPNPMPQIGSVLHFRAIDMLTGDVLYTGYDLSIRPPREPVDTEIPFDSTAMTLPFEQFNVKIELWFESIL